MKNNFTSPVDAGLLANAQPLLIGNSDWTFEQLNLAITNAVPMVKQLLATRRVHESAEDVLSDIRSDVYRRIAFESSPIENLFDYVAVLARNHVFRLSSEPGHHTTSELDEVADAAPTPEVSFLDNEQLRRLQAILELFLKPREYRFTNQRFILYWSKEQMATHADTSVRTIERDLKHVRTVVQVIHAALQLADKQEPIDQVVTCLPSEYLTELATTDISAETAANKYGVRIDAVERNRRYAKSLLNVAAHTHIFATARHSK